MDAIARYGPFGGQLCPGAAQAPVIGTPHPEWEERPLLVVVHVAGATVTAQLIAPCRAVAACIDVGALT